MSFKHVFSIVVAGLLALVSIFPAFADASALTADEAITAVYAYGFVDLEGAKTSAIIVEYAVPIDGASVDEETYSITDYTILLEESQGFEAAIEMDYDGIPGNEGQITQVYVSDEPEPSEQGAESGR